MLALRNTLASHHPTAKSCPASALPFPMRPPLKKLLLLLATACAIATVLPAQNATYSWTAITIGWTSTGSTGMCLDNAGNIYAAGGSTSAPVIYGLTPLGVPFVSVSGTIAFDAVVDNAGNIYANSGVAGSENIIKVTPTGLQTTLAAIPPGSDFLTNVAIDGTGNIWFFRKSCGFELMANGG